MQRISAYWLLCLLAAACTTAPHPDEAAIKKAERQQRENMRSFLRGRQQEVRERMQQAPDSPHLRTIDSFMQKTLDSINALPPL